MNNSQLNYQFDPSNGAQTRPTMVFLHGLFGDMNNLGIIARPFLDEYPLLRIDLRNHGRSFHSSEMNYPAMAKDVHQLLVTLNINKIILIGHSMGGKTAMRIANDYPELVEKLIVIDISPVSYTENHHDDVFAGLFAVAESGVTSRSEAKKILLDVMHDAPVTDFLLKSFDANTKERFRFNPQELFNNYAHLMHWEDVHCSTPTLFIRGGESEYIQNSHRESILKQFPKSRGAIISGAQHWVHAEKPQQVIRAIQQFIELQ